MENGIFPKLDEARVRSKICGVRSLNQARDIIDLGVDALGFNFWPKSKRYLDPADGTWLKQLAGKTIRVGVFVNADHSTIRELLDESFIDWAQLHGDESPELIRNLQEQGCRVFKALGIKDEASLDQIALFRGPVLLDAYAPTEYGGSGETMDWALGAKAVEKYPDQEVILAGGLNPDNVSTAIRQVRPAAVDVASGVEDEPGVKNLAKSEQFINAVRRSA